MKAIITQKNSNPTLLVIITYDTVKSQLNIQHVPIEYTVISIIIISILIFVLLSQECSKNFKQELSYVLNVF